MIPARPSRSQALFISPALVRLGRALFRKMFNVQRATFDVMAAGRSTDDETKAQRTGFAGANSAHAVATMTLAEMLIAASVLLALMAIALPAIVSQLRSSAVDTEMEAMRMESDLAKSYLVHDFASTSIQQMLTEYQADLTSISAIGLPIGALVDSATGKLSWNDAAVYYLTPNADGTQALVRAIVPYADFVANKADNKIIQDLRSGVWPAAKIRSKHTLLKRVSDYSISCQTQNVNCYAPAYGKMSVFLGTVLLAPNTVHTIRFECIGKDSQSTGYTIGLDRLMVSPANSTVEAENLTVRSQDVTSSADLTFVGAAWGNNAVLKLPFPACTPRSVKGVTLEFYTDTWWDSDFDGASGLANATRVTDTAASNDIVIAMDGANVETWNAGNQTGNIWGNEPRYDVDTRTVRVLLPGNQTYGFIPATTTSGGHPTITFRSGRNWNFSLKISEAYITERAGTTGFNGSTDSTKRWTIRFNGSTSSPEFFGDQISDPVLGMDFDKNKSYLVTYAVPAKSSGNYRASQRDLDITSDPLTMVVDGNQATVVDWSTLSGAFTVQAILGVKAVAVSYPCTASFLSAVLDTKEASVNPTLGTLTVIKKDVTNASIAINWRAGSTPDFSGTYEDTWYSSIAALPARRYIQYQALFATTQPISSSPFLRDVKLTWIPSATKSVDLAADVAVGPDLGMFKVKVDDSPPLMPYVRLWFNSEKVIFGGKYSRPLTVELNPRNP